MEYRIDHILFTAHQFISDIDFHAIIQNEIYLCTFRFFWLQIIEI